jgi:negative regulator of flagellin synthesis FlgM
MKIGPVDLKSLPAAPAAERRTTPAVKAGVEPSAKVDLNTSARLRSEGMAEPTFDAAKVERISQAIRDGSFKVNADAIADKLIANAQELLGRARR